MVDRTLKSHYYYSFVVSLSSSLLPSSFVVCFLAHEENNLSKAPMYYCFLVFCCIGESFP